MTEKHVVFGAGGGAGAALVRALSGQGFQVRAVARRAPADLPEGVEFVRVDATDHTAVRQACNGAGVVYHCVNVPYTQWEDTLSPLMEGMIAGAGAAGARLVYCDNLYMYGRVNGPLTESSPTAATSRKGRLRIRLADQLLSAHAAGRVEATIGRASDFFGPGANNTIASQLVFSAVEKGKTAHWIGSLDAPHTMSYIDDVARGLITLGTHDRAPGEVWHIPAGPPVTGREFIRMVFEIAGKPPRMGVYNRWMMRLAGLFDRNLREVLEVLYQFEYPFVLNADKFVQAFGDPGITDMRTAIAATYNWDQGRVAA